MKLMDMLRQNLKSTKRGAEGLGEYAESEVVTNILSGFYGTHRYRILGVRHCEQHVLIALINYEFVATGELKDLVQIVTSHMNNYVPVAPDLSIE